MSAQIFKSTDDFALELGGVLPGVEIAYHTYGTPNPDGDNVVWVCHALTANSDVADWWPGTVESECFLDPDRWFVVCANILGSCYGTTGPLSVNPTTGQPWFGTFPQLTMRDVVRAHILLADHLGIQGIHALVGSSVGGFQALEWAVMQPERFNKLVLIATAPKANPWTIAIDETQRMAIEADSTYGQPFAEAGAAGLAAARALGLLTYRGSHGYNITQQDPADFSPGKQPHRACTYQRHQGDKLVNRFNAYSYVTILDTFDTHDIGRDRGGIDSALASIKAKTMAIGLSTDIIFTPDEMRQLAQAIPGAEYRQIDSLFGHDGFLVENGQLNSILVPFINK